NYFEQDQVNYKDVETKLGLPMFIKPVNQGSSVGVSKVTNESEFYQALELAFNFDSKVMIEKGIDGREIEVSVLGDEELFVSVPGEFVSKTEFSSYASKYVDEDGAGLDIPANLDDELQEGIQDSANKTFRTSPREGMARVDVFLEQSG